jgi:hypothetical protein
MAQVRFPKRPRFSNKINSVPFETVLVTVFPESKNSYMNRFDTLSQLIWIEPE